MLNNKRLAPITLKSCLPKQQNMDKTYFIINKYYKKRNLFTSKAINNFLEISNNLPLIFIFIFLFFNKMLKIIS